MKFIDEFRNPKLIKDLAHAIKKISTMPVRFMELCGTHTMAISRYGLTEMLPSTLQLVSGPGCPVCVTTLKEIDQVIKLAQISEVIIATFGDLMHVPSSSGSSLAKERAAGAHIKVIYSPLDALKLALAEPLRQVVFLAIGFETTAPAVAAVILMAHRQHISNFSIFVAHKLLPAALDSLLVGPSSHSLNGFLCPGHVSTVIGISHYKIIAQNYGLACVVSGFEPADILGSIFMLVKQIEENRAIVEIQYTRAVSPQGNPQARALIDKVFVPIDTFWRGLGCIPVSGLNLAMAFSNFDAKVRFDLKVPLVFDHPSCSCGDILKGLIRPLDCKLFAKKCKPDAPLGPCMVSSEGTCAAWYKYRRNY